jgi:hypothetical protein
MAWLRTILAGLAAIPAVLIALLPFAFNGYSEDYGTPEAHTLPVAIPWSIATMFLIVTAVRAEVSPSRRERLSWIAISIATALVLIAGVLAVAASL